MILNPYVPNWSQQFNGHMLAYTSKLVVAWCSGGAGIQQQAEAKIDDK